MPKQPPSLKSLDDLFVLAEDRANYYLTPDGRMPPALFLIGSAGPMIYTPEHFDDVEDRELFAEHSRLICIAHNATSIVMAVEAWIKVVKLDEDFDLTELPSEALDRKEIVMLLGESRDRHEQKCLPIIRSDNGNFFGLGEPETSSQDQMEGRFVRILPKNKSTPKQRLLARAQLKADSVKVYKFGIPARRRRRSTS